MMVMPGPSADALLRGQIADPDCTWSLGGYGAAARFTWEPGEQAEVLEGASFGLVTARGALVLTAPLTLRPFAYETGFAGGWSQAVALCLPAAACAMGRRSVLTELGPDAAAVRQQDRAALLFDLGLGLEAADACVRTADPDLIGRLRAAGGRSILDPDHPALPALAETGLHTVFVTRLGRIEVYGSGAGPGPRSQILPKLVRLRRRHAATAPIPAGLVPCGEFRPAHPVGTWPGRRPGSTRRATRPSGASSTRGAIRRSSPCAALCSPDRIRILAAPAAGSSGRRSGQHRPRSQPRAARGLCAEVVADSAQESVSKRGFGAAALQPHGKRLTPVAASPCDLTRPPHPKVPATRASKKGSRDRGALWRTPSRPPLRFGTSG
jgi:hypothetical protein